MDYYISQIALFPYGYAPNEWMLCDGRTLIIQSEIALYCILGERFGGDRKTNFKIPDLRHVSPVSVDDNLGKCQYYICYRGRFPAREN